MLEQIENFPILDLGKSENLIDKTFGDFKVIYRTLPNKQNFSKCAYWLCQCVKCGQYIVKSSSQIKKSLTHNCENNLQGKRFGRWIVLYKAEKLASNRGFIWHCKCDCGKEKDVPADILKRGESQSCGCLREEKLKEKGKVLHDLEGRRFGKLVAQYPIPSPIQGKHTKWHCICDCGNEIDVDRGNLTQGFSQSCGCVISKEETNIIKLLINNQIPFIKEYTVLELEGKRFDFFVNNEYIIEFDGQQHFFYSGNGWDTKEAFEKRRKNDMEKNEYCFKNNIPLIRIPYNKKYCLEDLKLETTKFLITPENVENYYKNKEEKLKK